MTEMKEYTITRSEIKLRKHWLIATLVFYIIYPLSSLLFYSALSKIIHVPENMVNTALEHTVVDVILMLIVWYLVYIKYETAWLTFSLICNTCYVFMNTYRHLSNLNEATYIACTLVSLTIDIGLFLWWFSLSLKIRKINKFVQEERLLGNPLSLP